MGVIIVTKEPNERTAELEEEDDSDGEADDHPTIASTDLLAPQEKSVTAGSETEGTQAEEVKLRLWCGFTTESMAIAYASSEDTKPHVRIPCCFERMPYGQ